MSQLPLLTIHTDGASRGNPGAAAFAYVLQRDGQPTIEEAACVGRMTNNQAEYTALVRALQRALELGSDHELLIHSDSELIVKQMKGEYRVKDEGLRDLYEEARQLVRRFRGPVTIRHVRREQNARADQLCNEVLDEARGSGPRTASSKEATRSCGPGLHEEALECLREAGALPTAEMVWDQLQRLLRRHGCRLPRD